MITYDTSNSLKIIFTLRGSVIPTVIWHLVATLLIAVLVVLLHSFHVIGNKNSHGEFICPRPCAYYNYTLGTWDEELCTINDPPAAIGCGIELDPQVYIMLGTAVSLLLVFRSNLSYGRFWEARGTVGALIKSARDLARHAVFFVDGDDREIDAVKKDLLRQVQLFFHLTRLHLRGRVGPEWMTKDRHVKHLVDSEELEDLQNRPRKPLVILGFMSKKLHGLFLSKKVQQYTFLNMDNCISDLITAFNGLDKISKTPFPFPYAQLIFFLLFLYCYTAPWMLIQIYGWGTPFVSVIITGALFGINAIGLELEGPFGKDANDLPLDQMCEAVGADCSMFLSLMIRRGEHDVFGSASRMKILDRMGGVSARKATGTPVSPTQEDRESTCEDDSAALL